MSLFFDDFSILLPSNCNKYGIAANNNTDNCYIKQNNSNSNHNSNISQAIAFNTLSPLCVNPNTNPLVVPCSTPVTPPNLDYLEKAFNKLSSTTATECPNPKFNGF